MTAICAMALSKKPIPDPEAQEFSTANFLLPSGQDMGPSAPSKSTCSSPTKQSKLKANESVDHQHINSFSVVKPGPLSGECKLEPFRVC